MSVTLNSLIDRLQQLRTELGTGDIPVTVPIERPEEDCIEFELLEDLALVDIYDLDVEGTSVYGLYIDVHQTLTEEEPEDPGFI